jgi:hypothetical protein
MKIIAVWLQRLSNFGGKADFGGEINDILKLSGFNWLSNGKDSCWLKPLS